MTDERDQDLQLGCGDDRDKELWELAGITSKDVGNAKSTTLNPAGNPGWAISWWHLYDSWRQNRLNADIKAAAQSDELDLTNRDLRGLNLRGDTDNPTDNPAADLRNAALTGAASDCKTRWPQETGIGDGPPACRRSRRAPPRCWPLIIGAR